MLLPVDTFTALVITVIVIALLIIFFIVREALK